MDQPPLRVGLTGGIASGKSTVSDCFLRLGVPVIDADDIARALVEPGAAGYAPVIEAFGQDIVGEGGRLDRARLRRQVFSEPAQRRRLEAILHPLVRREIETLLASRQDAPYSVVSIPLMVETGQTDLVDRVLVVDCPEALQRERIARRPGWSEEDADAVIRSQATREERLRTADDVIQNDTDLSDLHRAVERLHRSYVALARPQARRPD